MNINTENFNEIFQEAIKYYHLRDDVNQPFKTPFDNEESFDAILYKKCWIDSVQWHLEDLIRDPDIEPEEAINYKRRIDNLNQQRTDLVEVVDDYLYDNFKSIEVSENAVVNTESPGWAIDRLSILNLKVYHWKEETERTDASPEHIQKAKDKLAILKTQFSFLTKAIELLVKGISEGKIIAPIFKQMKMYNDTETNPILRKGKKRNDILGGGFSE